jgi:nicotinamidase-related amidase
VFAGRADIPARHRMELARLMEDLTASSTAGWYFLISLHGGGSPQAMKPGGLTPMLIRRDDSVLFVVDEQARLAPAMFSRDQAVANTAILIRAATRLGVPVLASEQYPKGLGPTVPEIAALLPAGAMMEKMRFSCACDPGILARVAELGRRQVVVAGMEAHVCVLQTALGLKERGYEVHVVADATSSRRPESHALAMERLRLAGIPVVNTEMVVFEWLEQAGTVEFRELVALIK